MLPKDSKKLHFVGIGGCGMSGIAWVLLNKGYSISGSDLSENAMTRRLAANGARIALGHRAENVGDAETLVISSAIREDNPELMAARERGLQIVHRADALDQILRDGRSVAVAGTHGKTTTTSMLVLAAECCGLDPTALIGGELHDIGGNAKAGRSDLVIAEADESDGSFLKYAPDWAVVTNMEADHLDHYKTPEAVVEAYERFISQTRNRVALCVDDPRARKAIERTGAAAITYSIHSPEADFYARDIEWSGAGVAYDLHIDGEEIMNVQLGVPGVHNVANSLATLAICREIGADLTTAAQGLARYHGAQRRFQIKGRTHGVTIVDDYAHHPTEVKATLGSARNWQAVHQGRRIVGIFQPHRYSRTQALSADFGPVFSDAAEVIITDVYAAGELPIEGVNGELVYQCVLRAGHPNVKYIPSKAEISDYVAGRVEAGDLVMTLGAGDIWKVGEQLLERLNTPVQTA
ncbi:UDP-N-acetylmuramate--L-alanine ligase [Candidatus Sumerlaeota bacterium]|nr:UDP-N-acetylmuramate--L-alanine ligase [Candidatus Sumerlaeota bacterium]